MVRTACGSQLPDNEMIEANEDTMNPQALDSLDPPAIGTQSAVVKVKFHSHTATMNSVAKRGNRYRQK